MVYVPEYDSMDNPGSSSDTYFQSENALQDQPEPFRFMNLPEELRLKILEELVGTVRVTASLDMDGQMRIEEVHEDEDRDEWLSEWINSHGMRHYHRFLLASRSRAAKCSTKRYRF